MSGDIHAPVAKTVAAASSSVAGMLASSGAPMAAAQAAPLGGLAEHIVRWAPVTAAILGALYTLTMLAEWWWKRFWRPLLISRGLWSPGSSYFRGDSLRVPLDDDREGA